MSTSIWNLRGANGKLLSGDFGTGANWIGGVPGSASTALFDTGTYTVTASFSGATTFDGFSMQRGVTLAATADDDLTVNTLDLSTGATFTLASTGASASPGTTSNHLYISNAVNAGSIIAPTSYLSDSNTDSTIYNTGRIDVRRFSITSLDNTGTVVVEGLPGDVLGANYATGLFNNERGGTIDVFGRSNLIYYFQNEGLVHIESGATTTMNLNLPSYNGPQLIGGTYLIDGAFSLIARQGSIQGVASLVGADITLSNAAATFNSYSSGLHPVQTTLTLVDTHSALRLLGGSSWTASNALTLNGTLQLGNATYTGDLTQGSKSHITGTGTIDGDVTVGGIIAADAGGTLTVQNGTVDLAGKLAGAGTIAFSHDTLHVEASSAWTAPHVSLIYDTATMDGTRTVAATLDLTGGTLTLTSGAKLVETGTLHLVAADINGPGTLQLTGATTSEGIDAIEVATRNDGTVTVVSDTLSVFGAVSGSGHFVIGDEAQLNFDAGVARGTVIDMTGTHAALGLVAPDSFAGVLDGFGAGDSIDVSGFAAAGTTLTFKAGAGGVGGSLTLANGSHKDVLYLGDGNFASSAFHLGDDGHGGATITYAAPPSMTAHDSSIANAIDHHAMHYVIA